MNRINRNKRKIRYNPAIPLPHNKQKQGNTNILLQASGKGLKVVENGEEDGLRESFEQFEQGFQ